MSDDFGGKLQEIEKKEDEEGEGQESGEEEEPDKEMGDTEKGAETLDQQVIILFLLIYLIELQLRCNCFYTRTFTVKPHTTVYLES